MDLDQLSWTNSLGPMHAIPRDWWHWLELLRAMECSRAKYCRTETAEDVTVWTIFHFCPDRFIILPQLGLLFYQHQALLLVGTDFPYQSIGPTDLPHWALKIGKFTLHAWDGFRRRLNRLQKGLRRLSEARLNMPSEAVSTCLDGMKRNGNPTPTLKTVSLRL